MKVLLVSDVKHLGWLGDVVDVADGYARNYLYPQGLAQQVNDANVKAIAAEKEVHAGQRMKEFEKLEKAAAAVEGAEVVIAAKANEQGHLFGSVSGKEIAQNLCEQNFEVTADMIVLSEHIKQTGTLAVKVKFASELLSTINVVVVAEGEEVSSDEPEESNEQKVESESVGKDEQ